MRLSDPGHRGLFHTFFNIPICASSIGAHDVLIGLDQSVFKEGGFGGRQWIRGDLKQKYLAMY